MYITFVNTQWTVETDFANVSFVFIEDTAKELGVSIFFWPTGITVSETDGFSAHVH